VHCNVNRGTASSHTGVTFCSIFILAQYCVRRLSHICISFFLVCDCLLRQSQRQPSRGALMSVAPYQFFCFGRFVRQQLRRQSLFNRSKRYAALLSCSKWKWSSTEALLQALLDKVVVADAALPHCIGASLHRFKTWVQIGN